MTQAPLAHGEGLGLGRSRLGDIDAAYRQLRQACPVGWSPEARAWLVTAHEPAAETLRNPLMIPHGPHSMWQQLDGTVGIDASAVQEMLVHMPFWLDGVKHAETRRCIGGALSDLWSGVEERVPRHIERLLDDCYARGAFDLARDLAGRVSFEIIADLMDLSADERAELRPLAHLVHIVGPYVPFAELRAGADGVGRMMAILRHHVAGRPAGGDGLFDAIERRLPTHHRDDPEKGVVAIAATFLVAGVDPTASAVCIGVRALMDAGILQADWAEAGDDAIRLAGSVDLVMREAVAPTDIGGVGIPEGDIVLVSLRAAGRDPAAFGPDADRPRVASPDGPGLAFGAGQHLCIGMRLARFVVRHTFAALSRRPPLIPDGEIVMSPGRFVRTVRSLPVRVAEENA